MDGQTLLLLGVLLVIAYTMNIVPVLGPPLWTLVALFVAQWGVWLVPAIVASTFAAGLGRITLALISRRLGRSLIRAQQRDVDEIARLFAHRGRELIPAAFLYSLVLPTSWLFMSAGVMHSRLRPIFLGYWASRTVVDTFLVLGATTANVALVRNAVAGPQAIAMQLFGIMTFLIFLRVPWVRWLARLIERFEPAPITVEPQLPR